jgi:hypothetical protein
MNPEMGSEDHYDTISVKSGEFGKYICWNRSTTLRVRAAVIEVLELNKHLVI